MLNRYSSLPKANIRSSQELVGLGIIDTALQRQQKVYDEEASKVASTSQQLGNLELTGDYANAYKEKIYGDLKNKASEWSNVDLADPNVKSQVNGYISNLASDPELKYHMKAKQVYDSQQKSIQELESKGKLIGSQKYFLDKAWNQYNTTGKLPSEAQMNPMEASDLVSERGKLVSMIKASGGDAIKYLADGTAYKNSSKGVGSDKIANAVNEQLNTYKNSQAGKQERLDYLAAVDQGLIDSKKMSFDNYLRKEVMSTAKNYAYSDFSTNRDGAENESRKSKKEEETILTGTEGFKNPLIDSNQKYNSDGSMRTNSTVASWLFGTAFGNQELTEEDLQDPKKNIVRLGAKAQGITEKEYADKYGKQMSIPVWNYVKGTKRQDLTKLVSDEGAGILNSAAIVDKEGNTSTLKDKISQLGGETSGKGLQEWIKEHGIQVTGKVDPSAVSAEGYRISMNGEDFILDLTPSIMMKGNKASKEELQKLEAHLEHKYKAGYVEEVPTVEGNAVRFWNDDTNSIDYKLID